MHDRDLNQIEAAFAAGTAGDARAYEMALVAVAGLVRRIAGRQRARCWLDASDIEDVVQEVLLAVHQKRHTWDPARPLAPWLAGIVRYKFLGVQRAKARDRLSTSALLDDIAEIIPDTAVVEDASGSDILDFLPHLPGRERGVVVGLVIEGASPKSLAQRMAISENAVHAAWRRAVARLVRRFGRDGASR